MKAAIKEVRDKEGNYDESFKIKIIQEIEQGEISIYHACIKYGINDRSLVRTWLRESKASDVRVRSKKNIIEIKKDLERKIIKAEFKLQFFELENEILKKKLDLLTKKRTLV